MSEFKEQILIDDGYLKTLIADINHAKKSIDLEVYIFEDDSVGQRVSDALCNAAKRGVKIRVLVDGVGSTSWGGKITEQMELAGINTKVFHPLPWKLLHWNRSNYLPNAFLKKIFYLLSRMNSRNHRKVCIIDKNIVFVGSANIGDHLSDNVTLKKWRDTTIKITNVNVDEIQYAFDKAWGHIPIENRLRHIFKKIDSQSIFHLNYSWRLRHRYYSQLIKRISNCKKIIWVTNAYFIPDSHILKALEKASRNGIDVRILIPGKSDIIFLSMVITTFYSSLLNSGSLIYEYLPTILHAKILIIDDWTVVGSSNLNNRSFLHDLEIDVEIRNDQTKDIIEKQFLYDISQSRQIKHEDLKMQTLYSKLLGRFLLLIRYWL